MSDLKKKTQLILFMTIVIAASDKNTTILTEKGCAVHCVSVNDSVGSFLRLLS